MSEKSPAFQFYPGDYLKSERVAMMRLEEEGAYVRALLFCWTRGSIPSDPEKLAFLIGKGCSTNVATTVATMFQPDPQDSTRLRHDRLDSERAKQEAWSLKSSKGGKKSAEIRWRSKPPLQPPLTPPFKPNDNSSSSSSSSSSDKIIIETADVMEEISEELPRTKRKPRLPFVPPTIEEVQAFSDDRKLGLDAERFVNFYGSKGWLVGRAKMVDWHKAAFNARAWCQKAAPKTTTTYYPVYKPEAVGDEN